MNSPTRTLTSLFALAVAACGGSEDTTDTTATTAPATEADTKDDDTADPPDTSTGVEPTTGDDTTGMPVDPTTEGVDPCAECDANASCDGDACVCDDGYEGDGQSCADVDECAGKNDCAVDASCSNTPGGYDCACDEGYKGNGFNCEDVDECTEDLDTCSDNATCANQDGGYKCTCKDGFVGDGMVCNGSKQFGEPCAAGEDCASGMCVAGDFDMCTVACSQAVANDCGDQGLTGLCVQVDVNMTWCAGDLTFGADKDDEILKPGDKIKRDFQSKTDADLFLINIVIPGDYLITATPDPDDDLQLDFYNGDASELGTSNMFGIGQPEAGIVTAQGGVLFVVVRNIGASNGAYSIEIVKQ